VRIPPVPPFLQPFQVSLVERLDRYDRGPVRIEVDEEHCYTVNGEEYPSVTQVLSGKRSGSGPPVTSPDLERGTRVHYEVEDIVAPDVSVDALLADNDPEPRLDGYRKAWAAAQLQLRFRPLLTEVRVFNEPMGYCGQADLVGLVEMSSFPWFALPAVADLKSKKTKKHKMARSRTCQQVAAYCAALSVMAGIPFATGFGIGLSPDGTPEIVVMDASLHWARFGVKLGRYKENADD
jgi:hypothetical protein